MAASVIYPNVEEFDQLISGGTPILVDFWAEWCMPCKMLGPVIEQLGEQYQGRVTVAKVDVDEHSELAARYGIQSIPTVIVFNKGEIVDTIVGLRNPDAYTKVLDGLLNG
ncbi:MAG TPA: thioredoxin [Candidatus Avimonas sp.]|nr:thioredoxin [Candidatus Avimonas sp.]